MTHDLKIKMMFDYLSDKPIIGMISGLGSAGMLMIQSSSADESVLSAVAALGVFGGTAVAILTGLLKMIELYDVITRRFKKKVDAKETD